jgi:hypothetical protein
VVDPAVRVFLQTRGTARATDYAFLGGAPPEPWWRDYRDATAFDHPTVLVSSDGDRWAAYLSGIPAARVDAVGTVVRYTLVLDGVCAAPDTACVAAAVGTWLDDVAAGHGTRPGGRLAAALDARFPAVDVERWLTESEGSDKRHFRRIGSDESAVRQEGGASAEAAVGDDVRQRVLAALAALPVPAAAPAADEPVEWIAAVGAPAARSAFVARVAALVGGIPGRALLLNLLGGADDVAALLDPASPVVVLVEGADPPAPQPVQPAVGAKKAPAPPARGVTVVAMAGIAVVPLVVWFVLLATTALVVMAVMGLL